jgi:hypothetical protein
MFSVVGGNMPLTYSKTSYDIIEPLKFRFQYHSSHSRTVTHFPRVLNIQKFKVY